MLPGVIGPWPLALPCLPQPINSWQFLSIPRHSDFPQPCSSCLSVTYADDSLIFEASIRYPQDTGWHRSLIWYWSDTMWSASISKMQWRCWLGHLGLLPRIVQSIELFSRAGSPKLPHEGLGSALNGISSKKRPWWFGYWNQPWDQPWDFHKVDVSSSLPNLN